ncbi:PSPA7_2676 family Cys-rich small protein [Pseudomonas subflava]|uniref:PSPA7_2676 family Cys-rich small protein n=1 Tax=Pseudomonas subflava TaxID=2952933 RepID=UPI0020799901|nr:PSPA7_2676 family Cys-rich small protein [Pseudomonas subflava]
MTLLCLISGCHWFPSCAEAVRLGGSELLHESCSRCGTRRYRRPGDDAPLFSLRPTRIR